MGVGKEIRRIRIALGMTQEELASRMNYKSKSTINKIELEINDIPLSKVEAFASVLGVAPSELMGWTASTQSESDDVQDLLELAKKMDPSEIEQLLSYARFIKSNSSGKDNPTHK